MNIPVLSRFFAFFALGLLMVLTSGAYAAKNVILIIGDGMDDQQITAARNYLEGAQGKTVLDRMAIRSAVQVLTVDEHHPDTMVYVADSANSATAMATGVTTSIGRIGTSAHHDNDLTTIIELAEKKGMKTGLVTTASVTDATPASFIAHVNNRGCEIPARMVAYEDKGARIIDCASDIKAKGGLGSISEQIAVSQVDVVMGGGAKYFRADAEGTEQPILDVAKHNGFEVVSNLNDANQVSMDKKLLGLFGSKTLPVRLQGTDGRIAEEPEFSFLNWFHRYLGTVDLPDVMGCEANPEFTDKKTPHLKDMSKIALDRLQNSNGFFLMIESASIDKQSHKRNPCGSIGEAEQLFETVDLALEFTKTNPDTLIMITADHGQAAQVVPNGSLFDVYGVPVATPGAVARIRTPEGGVMAINYATNSFNSEEHTGVNVPLFANKNVLNKAGKPMINGLIQQREIFDISTRYLELDGESDLAGN